MELYPFQQRLLGDIGAAWRQGYRDICLQLATGAGKTVIAGEMIRRILAQNRRILVLVHRDELLKQFTDTLHTLGMGLDVGRIRAGSAIFSALPIQIASVQTLVRRLKTLPKTLFDITITDEAHHAAAEVYQKIYRHYDKAHRLGLTATPARLDNKPLKGTFDHLVLGPETRWLIDNEYLSEYKAMRISKKFELGEDTIADVRQVIQEYVGDRKTIVFAASRAEAQHITRNCQEAGMSCEYLDGETPMGRRRQVLDRLHHGNLQIVVNVDLISEGFDCPNVKCIILNRPTESITVHLQQIGRGLRRTADGDPTLIIDLVGNLKRLGKPDDKYLWSLSDGVSLEREEKKPEDEPEQKPMGPFPVGPFTDVPVTLVHVAGTPMEIRPGETGTHKMEDVRKAVRICKTKEDLQDLGRSLGYSKKWANRQWEFKSNYAGRLHRSGKG